MTKSQSLHRSGRLFLEADLERFKKQHEESQSLLRSGRLFRLVAETGEAKAILSQSLHRSGRLFLFPHFSFDLSDLVAIPSQVRSFVSFERDVIGAKHPVAIPSQLRSFVSAKHGLSQKIGDACAVAIPSQVRSFVSWDIDYYYIKKQEPVAIPSQVRSFVSPAMVRQCNMKLTSQSLHRSGRLFLNHEPDGDWTEIIWSRNPFTGQVVCFT